MDCNFHVAVMASAVKAVDPTMLVGDVGVFVATEQAESDAMRGIAIRRNPKRMLFTWVY